MEHLFCLAEQNVRSPSAELTGLLPQRITEPGEDVAFSTLFVGDGEIPLTELPPSFLGNYYYSNPQLGPMYLNLEKTLMREELYGVFISYTYNTPWNVDTIEHTLGVAPGVEPEDLLAFDGVVYVNLDTSTSTKVDGSSGTFGKITAAMQGTGFHGTGHLFVDDEIIVMSGPKEIHGWDIGGGLSTASSRPTITQDILVSSTEAFDDSYVSPAYVHSYIEPETGKRAFLIGMQDVVETVNPDVPYCISQGVLASECGGFIVLDRDALWVPSPISAVTRLCVNIISALGCGSLTSAIPTDTPSDFVVSLDNNKILSGMDISKLIREDELCTYIHSFQVSILGYDILSPITPESVVPFDDGRITFHSYTNGQNIFRRSTMWHETGDILKSMPIINSSFSPPFVSEIEPNYLQDPNLHVPTPWKQVTGHMPILVSKLSEVSTDLSLYYGIDFYTGGIFAVSTIQPYDESSQYNAWSVVYVGWLPIMSTKSETVVSLNETEDITFYSERVLPLPMDMKFTTDGKFIFVAAYGLGQIIAYHREKQDDVRIKFCGAAQLTNGQTILTHPLTYTHPARPGVPLHGGPVSLSIDPTNRFLYVTTGSPLDNCIYSSADTHGSFIVRYTINSFTCGPQTLVLDPAFFVSSFDLPPNIVDSKLGSASEEVATAVRGLPARFGDITFAVGDGSNMMNTNK